MYRYFLKKLFDTIIAFLGIIVLLIPMVVIAIAIKVDSKGPAIFRQERLGKGKKKFTIYKFRTMVNNAYQMGGIANRSDDARITKVGAFLRRTSLDELPQLFNIVKGDMAIIGPRPILDWEFEEYANHLEYARRYDVLPGLFCTVDIDLRASATREEQFTMDIEYIDSMSLWNDIKYCLQIVKSVVSGKNVYREEVAEQEEE
ncbi:MAG: sugar transferase [Lachnospiraceae bacterium]|nr:sugar transferase [Lachnospiraceae bacterium]